MKLTLRFAAFLLITVFAGAGCSALPGLRVLAGQDTGETAQNRLVETSELVMANKTGTTDPALNSVADRIESASGNTIDIIEIRNDLNNRSFQVYALYLPDPRLSQADELNQERRAFELVWRGIMQQSIGAETLDIQLVDPLAVNTLDRGLSFIGRVVSTVTIPRNAALLYLNDSPSLQNFVGLVADGTLAFIRPSTATLYSGTPNHPVFMLSQLTGASSN